MLSNSNYVVPKKIIESKLSKPEVRRTKKDIKETKIENRSGTVRLLLKQKS